MDSTYDDILIKREITNEKRVAVIRLFLALAGILEFLAYFDIISFFPKPSLTTLLLSFHIFTYSVAIIVILFKVKYIKKLKYFIIILDYSYVVISFILDKALTTDLSTIKWYAFAAAVVFYLINLLRYSRDGTIFAGILSELVYLSVCIYFKIPPVDIFTINIPLFIILFIGYSVTISQKKMMIEANTKKMMERYLPPELVGELYKNNLNLTPGGDVKNVTILFSDIRAFTTISEKISPKKVVELLNNYLSIMTELIFSNHGTIDKFIGDAIMTIFGAPMESEDDAYRAVKTAIDMQKSLDEFNKTYLDNMEPLKLGIGIHTGEVIAGNIGSKKRLDYTVIGDTVNLTSRIEGLTVHYPCPILISDSTYNELTLKNQINEFTIREVDWVRVKGRSNSLTIYEVLTDSIKGNVTLFEQGLNLYRSKDFTQAITIFEKLEKDKLSQLYIKRCNYFLDNPPDENWNGVFIMESK